MTHPSYSYAKTPNKVIFERKDSLWMRLVKYEDNTIGIQVCPLKAVINGGPVWQDYTDSAPANALTEFFVALMDIDLTAELVKLRSESISANSRITALMGVDQNKDRLVRELKEQIADQRNRIDVLDADLRRLKRQGDSDAAVFSDGPYR